MMERCTQDGKLSDVRRMGAGFAAGITEALVIVTPFEVVKIRLQQQRGMSKELLKYRVRRCRCQAASQHNYICLRCPLS